MASNGRRSAKKTKPTKGSRYFVSDKDRDKMFRSFLFGPYAKGITIFGGALAAFFFINSALVIPTISIGAKLADSGPLPVPSRQELIDLKTDIEGKLASSNESIKETLEVAKAARIEAQQSVLSSNLNRLDRLMRFRIETQAALDSRPGDLVLRQSLESTNQEIARLQLEQNILTAPAIPSDKLPSK